MYSIGPDALHFLKWEFFGTRQKLDCEQQKEAIAFMKSIEKEATDMEKANIDYVLDIFRTLSGELPEQMLYRDNGDSMELKTLDSIGNCLLPDLQNSGWNVISSHMAGAATL